MAEKKLYKSASLLGHKVGRIVQNGKPLQM